MSIYKKLFILNTVVYIRCKNHQEVVELFDIIAWFGNNSFMGKSIEIGDTLRSNHRFDSEKPIYRIPNLNISRDPKNIYDFNRRIFVKDEKTAATECNNILDFDSLVIDSIIIDLTKLENKLKT